MAQVPGMFTTQQQVLCKTIGTEIVNAAKHFKMKMFLKIKSVLNKLEFFNTRLQ